MSKKGRLETMLEVINSCVKQIGEGNTSEECLKLLKDTTKDLKHFQHVVLEEMSKMQEEPEVEIFDVPVDIGMKVRCKVTGYVGIITVKNQNLHRVPQFCVQSKVNSIGDVGKSVIFDACQLEVLNKEPIVKCVVPEFKIEMGACVKDTVTNFKGTVITRELHMNGCVRLRVRNEYVPGDETTMSTAIFDEGSCEVVPQKKTVKPAPRKETTGCAMEHVQTDWN